LWKAEHFETMSLSACQSLQLHQPIIWYFRNHLFWQDPDIEATDTERQAGKN